MFLTFLEELTLSPMENNLSLRWLTVMPSCLELEREPSLHICDEIS